MSELPTPSAIRKALTAAGFNVVGKGRGYSRWQWPGDTHRDASLIVPDDPGAPEFEELIESLSHALRDAVERGMRAQNVLVALTPPPDPRFIMEITPQQLDAFRYPHASCHTPPLADHEAHTFGDPIHYCDGQPR